MNEYVIKRLGNNTNEIEQCSQFLCSRFSLSSSYTKSNKASFQYLHWLYFENPMGKAIAYSAFYNNEMVSHFATVPVIYKIDGTEMRGVLALNLVTHPEHRGKGLFIEIANRTLDDAKEEGYNFVVGVANQNSSHGLIKKLGFDFIANLDVIIGVGKIIPIYEDKYRLAPVWSQESLKWRFSNPSSKIFKTSKGCFIVPTGKFNVYAQLTSRPYAQQNSFKPQTKFAPFKVWIGLSASLKRKGIFINLPKVLKPVPLNLIYKNLKGNNETLNPKEILFELIDFDAY